MGSDSGYPFLNPGRVLCPRATTRVVRAVGPGERSRPDGWRAVDIYVLKRTVEGSGGTERVGGH